MVGSGSDSDGGCLSSVFTSDDDHAQLQAYVMTLVLLRGCIVVSISSFDFYYGTI